MLATLQAKRSALTASLEQLVGQINRVNGAIAVVDELIAEEAEQMFGGAAAEDAWNTSAFPAHGGIDRAAPFEFPPPQPAPEMLQVVRGTGDDTEEESTLCNVHFRGDGIPQYDL